MRKLRRAIVTHGGSGSNPVNSDGPQAAASVGMELMARGEEALTAVVQAVRFLENDPRFNAGVGSHLRADGKSVQMDASCMVSSGKFGAVGCLEGCANPIEVAKEVLLQSNHILLVGEGARRFAEEKNIVLLPLERAAGQAVERKHIPPSCDTVGAVAFDGSTFAAALSTGGLKKAAIGRVGDVPLPGCGLFCGPAGAVACTGNGESIATRILAKEVYGWLEQNISPAQASKRAMTFFDNSVDIGLIVLTGDNLAAQSRTKMAWAYLIDEN